MSETDSSQTGPRPQISANGRMRLATAFTRGMRTGHRLPVTPLLLRGSRFAGWAERTAARYGVRPAGAPDAAIVLRDESRDGDTVVDARSSHLHLSQSWAPRLQLTLVTYSQTDPGQARRTGEVSSIQATPETGWHPVRPVLAAPNIERVIRLSRPVALASGDAAVAPSRRLARRTEAIDLVIAGPSARATAEGVDPGDNGASAARRSVPAAAPVERVMAAQPAQARARDLQTPAYPSLESEQLAPPRAPISPPAALETDPATIDRISERVMSQLSHRIQSYRERTGRA